jgi:hypothetical protein
MKSFALTLMIILCAGVADFQIGTMPSALVPGTLKIQFADRIDAEPKTRWPQGAPVKIQMSDDDGPLRFYDID